MLSVIVPISGADKSRIENFAEFVKCIAAQSVSDFEFIVVEQVSPDSEASRYGGILERYGRNHKHFVVEGVLFNKSWLVNIGAKRSQGQTLVFMDADVLFGHDYFAGLLESLPFRYLLGWSQAIFLSAAGRRDFLEKGYQKERCLVDRTVIPEPGSSSCMGLSNVFDRDFFFHEVVGYNETFTQWGGEDCDIMKRALAADGEWHQFDYTVYHLFHGGRIRGGKNTEMWNWTDRHPNEVTTAIRKAGTGSLEGPRKLAIRISAAATRYRILAILEDSEYLCEGADRFSMKEAILQAILDWIRENVTQPTIAIHVGNYLGVSLGVLAVGLKVLDPESLVIAIDPDLTYRQSLNTEKAVTMLMRKLDVEEMVLRLTGYSMSKSINNNAQATLSNCDGSQMVAKDLAAQWQLKNLAKLIQGKVDFVLLDGNHDKHYVEEEIEISYRLLRPGGAIFLDDITRHYPEMISLFHSMRVSPKFVDSWELNDGGEVRAGVLIKGDPR